MGRSDVVNLGTRALWRGHPERFKRVVEMGTWFVLQMRNRTSGGI